MPCILDTAGNSRIHLVTVFVGSPDNAVICQNRGLTFVCHNDLQNVTAEWLSKICYDVAIELPVQLLTGEVIEPKTANHQDETRAEHSCQAFWDSGKVPF